MIADKISVVVQYLNMKTHKIKIWDSTYVHLHQETFTTKAIVKESSQMEQTV